MTNTQKFYTLLGLVCEDFPHYAVDMAVAAGYPGERQRLHDVKRGRTVDLPDLVALVRYSLPRFEVPAHLLPGEESVAERIATFVKELFLLFRLEKLEVSAKWLTACLNDGHAHRVEEYEVVHFLKRERGLAPSSVPVRLQIPSKADYSQGRVEITAYHVEVARYYTLRVQDWLPEQEMALFTSPLPAPVTA